QGHAALIFRVLFFLALLVEQDFIKKTAQAFVRAFSVLTEIAQDIVHILLAAFGFLMCFAMASQLGDVANFADETLNRFGRIRFLFANGVCVAFDQFEKTLETVASAFPQLLPESGR